MYRGLERGASFLTKLNKIPPISKRMAATSRPMMMYELRIRPFSSSTLLLSSRKRAPATVRFLEPASVGDDKIEVDDGVVLIVCGAEVFPGDWVAVVVFVLLPVDEVESDWSAINCWMRTSCMESNSAQAFSLSVTCK